MTSNRLTIPSYQDTLNASKPTSLVNKRGIEAEQTFADYTSTFAERKQHLVNQAKTVEKRIELPKSLWDCLHAGTREIHHEAMQNEFLKI